MRTTICTVLDIVNDKQTILASSEEKVVVIADLHALNGLAVSLYLVDFAKLRNLEYMNGSRFAFFTHTSNESFLIGSKHNLGELNASIKPVFVVLAVPDFFVTTDSVHLERLSRDVHDRSKIDVLLVKVLVVESLLVLLLHY